MPAEAALSACLLENIAHFVLVCDKLFSHRTTVPLATGFFQSHWKVPQSFANELLQQSPLIYHTRENKMVREKKIKNSAGLGRFVHTTVNTAQEPVGGEGLKRLQARNRSRRSCRSPSQMSRLRLRRQKFARHRTENQGPRASCDFFRMISSSCLSSSAKSRRRAC